MIGLLGIALKYKQFITVTYIDYSKAFDVVSHLKLFFRNWLPTVLMDVC